MYLYNMSITDINTTMLTDNNSNKRQRTDSGNHITSSNSTQYNNNAGAVDNDSVTGVDINVVRYPIESFSDLVLKYDNTEFYVHKQVLACMLYRSKLCMYNTSTVNTYTMLTNTQIELHLLHFLLNSQQHCV